MLFALCMVLSGIARSWTLLGCVAGDAMRLVLLRFRTERWKDAYILALEKQLASYLERGIKPRLSDPRRLSLALTGLLLGGRDAVRIVTPATLIRWQRRITKLAWWLRSRPPGRPPLPAEVQALIIRMAGENPNWSAGRIARELRTKLGLRVDTNTLRRYMPQSPIRRGGPRGDQRWSTFIRNHAKTIVACDFAVTMRAGLSTLYILVVIELESRRILHINVTDHPTAEWTTQQLREAIPADGSFTYLLHDRDAIFSHDLDEAVKRLGLKILRSPPRSPKANGRCERLIGTLRRELLDWIIPLAQTQLLTLVREWATHYNRERPHMALDLRFPEPLPELPVPLLDHRHRLPLGSRVVASPVAGGLHHEYCLERDAA